MSQYDWPSMRARAPAFPWDAQPRAPARRGAPSLSDDAEATPPPCAKPAAAMALVPVQFGVGAFRAPIPRVMLATVVRVSGGFSAAAPRGPATCRRGSFGIARCALTPAPRALQVPPGSFGRGGAACGFGAPACCGEASDAGESGATARSIFGFPSGGASMSVSVSQSCAAFGAGDDGAEVTSGAAQAAAQHAGAPQQPLQLQPLPLQRGPSHFFTQLGPPPGLGMNYAAAAVPSQEHMAVDAAAPVPCAPPGRNKRSVPEEWVAVERPPRVYRGCDEDDMAYDQARACASRNAARPLIHAPCAAD